MSDCRFGVLPVKYSDPDPDPDPDLDPLAGQYYFISSEKPHFSSHEPLGS